MTMRSISLPDSLSDTDRIAISAALLAAAATYSSMILIPQQWPQSVESQIALLAIPLALNIGAMTRVINRDDNRSES